MRNPRVRAMLALHRSRGRREAGHHLVEGPNAVLEALHAGVVRELYATPDARERELLPDGVALTPIAQHVLDRVTDAATPQGVVAVAHNVTTTLDDLEPTGLLVVLHEVADPGNAGTILRTADAAGARGVVLTAGSVDVYSPKAVRAAAGSTYHLPLVTEVALGDVVAACHAAGRAVYGLEGRAPASVFDAVPPPGVALVLGNETHGLAPDVTAQLDAGLAVPIYGRAESLNVAAAAAIGVYAVARRLRAGDATGAD